MFTCMCGKVKIYIHVKVNVLKSSRVQGQSIQIYKVKVCMHVHACGKSRFTCQIRLHTSCRTKSYKPQCKVQYVYTHLEAGIFK